MLEHPDITRTLATGFPYSDRREVYAIDALRQEVHPGDEILVLEDEFFLVEPLGPEAKEVLEVIGATYQIAK